LFIVVLIVSVAAMAATAAYSLTFGGFSINIVPKTSYYLHAEALLKGIGFCLDGQCAEVGVILYADSAVCNCENPGGSCGGLGSPFYPDAPFGAGLPITEGMISGKGTAWADICWYSDYITQELSKVAPPEYCKQNNNWGGICSDGDCYITQLDATFYGCALGSDGISYLVQKAKLNNCTIDLSKLPGAEQLDYQCPAPELTKYKLTDKITCPNAEFTQIDVGMCIGE
jgi:hypothetical protein